MALLHDYLLSTSYSENHHFHYFFFLHWCFYLFQLHWAFILSSITCDKNYKKDLPHVYHEDQMTLWSKAFSKYLPMICVQKLLVIVIIWSSSWLPSKRFVMLPCPTTMGQILLSTKEDRMTKSFQRFWVYRKSIGSVSWDRDQKP